MKRLNKRPILLLEVLIAFALVALCAIPLLAPQVGMIRSERRFLNEIEADRLANVIFTDIVEKMYQREISWEALFNQEEVPVNWVSHPPYAITYRFVLKQGKPTKSDPQYALFNLWVTMASKEETLTFEYEIFVEKEQGRA